MIKISTEKFPKIVINDIAYTLYYTLNWYVPYIILFTILMNQKIIPQMTDYNFFI